MILPSETEAGSAGMQPCRGIAWWAHRDDDRERGSSPLALFQNCIGSKDPHALKIPARRAECSLTGNVLFPLHAEPRHFIRLSASPKSWAGVFCVFLTKPCSSTMRARVTQKITRADLSISQVAPHFPQAVAETPTTGMPRGQPNST